jgi:uncharacterized protein YjiS (DUF1127 family)
MALLTDREEQAMTEIGLTRSATFSTGFCWRTTCMIRYLAIAWQVHRERQRLSSLDSRQLADAGIAPDAAAAESNRAFWDVPARRSHAACRCGRR